MRNSEPVAALPYPQARAPATRPSASTSASIAASSFFDDRVLPKCPAIPPLVRQNGQGLKKPRVRAGLFRIPIPPSGALPPGGMETLPDAAKTRLQHISFFCCRSDDGAARNPQAMALSDQKNPAEGAGLSGKHPGRKLPRSSY